MKLLPLCRLLPLIDQKFNLGLFLFSGFLRNFFHCKMLWQGAICSSTVFQRWNLCCISQHSWWTHPCRHRTRHQSWHYQCLRAELASVQHLLDVQMTCHPLWVYGQGSFYQWYKLKASEWDLLVTQFSPALFVLRREQCCCQWPRYWSEWAC